jgi:hypothetical protein
MTPTIDCILIPIGSSKSDAKILSSRGNKTFSTRAHKISYTTNPSSRLGSKPILWVVSRIGSLFLDPEIVFSSDQAWFTSNQKVNKLNNIYLCFKLPHSINKVPLHHFKSQSFVCKEYT